MIVFDFFGFELSNNINVCIDNGVDVFIFVGVKVFGNYLVLVNYYCFFDNYN